MPRESGPGPSILRSLCLLRWRPCYGAWGPFEAALLLVLPELREPDRVAAASGVLGDMRDNIEAAAVEQRAVLGFIQAGMVKRLTPEAAECLAMRRAAGEHQSCIR